MIVYVPGPNIIRYTEGYTLNLQTGEPHYLDAAAVVEFRVQTPGYADVPGQVWPGLMTWITGSTGDFLGIILESVAMQPGLEYRLMVRVNNGINQVGTWDIPLHARSRF